MSAPLPPTGWVHLPVVDSTNAEAFRRAPGVHPGPLWILADAQTAGKGRRAREWKSPPGNFYGSLLLKTEDPPQLLGLRSFAAALALQDAFVALTGLDANFALKWPNDVLLNGGKISGILLEAQKGCLVIGIGVNLIGHPPLAAVETGAVQPVSLLGETGLRVTPAAFLAALAPAMAHWEAIFQAEGFAPLRRAFLAKAARLGEKITARTGNLSREGIFETIDDEGNLVLRMAHETVAIPAADVFF